MFVYNVPEEDPVLYLKSPVCDFEGGSWPWTWTELKISGVSFAQEHLQFFDGLQPNPISCYQKTLCRQEARHLLHRAEQGRARALNAWEVAVSVAVLLGGVRYTETQACGARNFWPKRFQQENVWLGGQVIKTELASDQEVLGPILVTYTQFQRLSCTKYV